MKLLRNIICLAAVAMLCCSCVSRTVTRTPKLSETGKGKINTSGKVVEKKIVWFWQDDF